MTSAANSGNILMGLGLEAILAQFANSETYYQNLTAIFGNQYDTSKAETLRIQWQEGDFSNLPAILVLPVDRLPSARGAYSIATDTIYIADRQTSFEGLVNLLLEEIGHAIDRSLNLIDTKGDEGAIFAAFVLGQELSPEILNRWREEDDRAMIVVDGRELVVEKQDIVGTNNDDNLQGTASADIIEGLAGNDTIFGGGVTIPCTETTDSTSSLPRRGTTSSTVGGNRYLRRQLSERDQQRHHDLQYRDRERDDPGGGRKRYLYLDREF